MTTLVAAARECQPVREHPSGLTPLVRRLRDWIQETRCFPALEKDRESVEALLEQIADYHASLETPLRILLLGGSGVGKSTVFNALAGADLAPTASVRPTTRELTAYYHEANGSGALGALEACAKLVSHQRSPLRDKVVVDAPDFDSTVLENRELLEQALLVTDLVLCVVTSEKYLSSELFDLIGRYRTGLEFVFILNKLDVAEDGSLVAQDLRDELERRGLGRARILSVSALAVREAQRAAFGVGAADVALGDDDRFQAAIDYIELPSGAGHWRELRALLERELDRLRIRQIKVANLGERLRGALVRIEAHVGGGVPQRIDAWRVSWHAALGDVSADLSGIFFGAIHDDFELRNVLRYLFGTAFDGIFGLFMKLVYGVRVLLMPGFARARRFTSVDLEELIRKRLRTVEIAQIERRVQLVLEGFEQEGRRLGFEPPPREPGALPGPRHGSRAVAVREKAGASRTEGVAALVVAIRSEAAGRFCEIFEEMAGGAGARAGRLIWNVLPLAVITLAIYAFGTVLVPGVEARSVADRLRDTGPMLEGALVHLLVVCWLQWPFAERLVERRIRISLGLLERVVSTSVESCLSRALVKEPERVMAEVLERWTDLERMRDDLSRLPEC